MGSRLADRRAGPAHPTRRNGSNRLSRLGNETCHLTQAIGAWIAGSPIAEPKEEGRGEPPFPSPLTCGIVTWQESLYLRFAAPSPESHAADQQFLVSLAIFDHYEWETTPLETFEELEKRLQ